MPADAASALIPAADVLLLISSSCEHYIRWHRIRAIDTKANIRKRQRNQRHVMGGESVLDSVVSNGHEVSALVAEEPLRRTPLGRRKQLGREATTRIYTYLLCYGSQL